MTDIPLKIGDDAPDFTLPTDSIWDDIGDGDSTLTLSNFQGQKVVLYFYPKDNTPGCTTQACDFRDRHPDFTNLGVQVIGVSKDEPKKHDRFKEKYNLNFPLVSDDDNSTLCKLYGVWRPKKFMGREFLGIVRSTFVIDEVGKIAHIWDKVRVKNHAQDVLQTLDKMG